MSVRYTEVNHRHNTHNSLLFSAVFVVACPAHVRGRDGKRCLCGRFVAAAVAAACSTLARWLARWRCGYTLRCRGLRRCCATDGRALQARPTSGTRVWTDCQPIRCMWRPPRDDSLRHCRRRRMHTTGNICDMGSKPPSQNGPGVEFQLKKGKGNGTYMHLI